MGCGVKRDPTIRKCCSWGMGNISQIWRHMKRGLRGRVSQAFIRHPKWEQGSLAHMGG